MGIDAGNHAVDEIGTVEGPHQHLRIAQFELFGDVDAHALGCRRRVGVHAGIGKARLKFRQAAVFRPEVVAPVADAMGLVDGEGANSNSFDQLQETRHQQTLRRDEDKPIPAGDDLRFDGADGFGIHAAV